MERLGIVSFYDGEGVVDGSVEYYIKSLCDVVSEIIVVVNGNISNIGQIQLDHIADECIIRQNTGFDAGAYKEVLCRQNFVQKMKEYDEIVLCNDTCFGPFKSFSGIFAEMEHKKVDFWGLDFVENKVADYLQSYFLVFSKISGNITWRKQHVLCLRGAMALCGNNARVSTAKGTSNTD